MPLQINVKTKHTLAAHLLGKLPMNELKQLALSVLSSGIDYLPTVLEFNVAQTGDVERSEYLYVIIEYGVSYEDITHMTYVDGAGVDIVVKDMLDELMITHDDVGLLSQKEFGMLWLSEYDEDDIEAFD